MKFAYADPPYPGQAKRLYGSHPDYAGEVDHAELIARLERDYPDGWALSTNAVSIQAVLALCPTSVRVAAWHKRGDPPSGREDWTWQWEPVIVRGGRSSKVSNVLSCPALTSGFVGAKPSAFTRWMLALLGAEPADQIDDLFPGSGAVAEAIESWRRQPRLPMSHPVRDGHPERVARDLRRRNHPDLFEESRPNG